MSLHDKLSCYYRRNSTHNGHLKLSYQAKINIKTSAAHKRNPQTSLNIVIQPVKGWDVGPFIFLVFTLFIYNSDYAVTVLSFRE